MMSLNQSYFVSSSVIKNIFPSPYQLFSWGSTVTWGRKKVFIPSGSTGVFFKDTLFWRLTEYMTIQENGLKVSCGFRQKMKWKMCRTEIASQSDLAEASISTWIYKEWQDPAPSEVSVIPQKFTTYVAHSIAKRTWKGKRSRCLLWYGMNHEESLTFICLELRRDWIFFWSSSRKRKKRLT